MKMSETISGYCAEIFTVHKAIAKDLQEMLELGKRLTQLLERKELLVDVDSSGLEGVLEAIHFDLHSCQDGIFQCRYEYQ